MNFAALFLIIISIIAIGVCGWIAAGPAVVPGVLYAAAALEVGSIGTLLYGIANLND